MEKPKIFDGTKWIEFNSQNELDVYIKTNSPVLSDETSVNTQRVQYKKERGAKIIERFLVENEAIEISDEKNGVMLQAFSPLMILLEKGAFTMAKNVLNQIPPDTLVVTPQYKSSLERWQSYIDEIQKEIDYMNAWI